MKKKYWLSKRLRRDCWSSCKYPVSHSNIPSIQIFIPSPQSLSLLFRSHLLEQTINCLYYAIRTFPLQNQAKLLQSSIMAIPPRTNPYHCEQSFIGISYPRPYQTPSSFAILRSNTSSSLFSFLPSNGNRIRNDLKWEDVWESKLEDYCEKHRLYYQVSKGRQQGVPSCRGCKRQLSDRSEPRVRTTVMITPLGMYPRPVKVNFCISLSCIQLALQSYEQNVSKYE